MVVRTAGKQDIYPEVVMQSIMQQLCSLLSSIDMVGKAPCVS